MSYEIWTYEQTDSMWAINLIGFHRVNKCLFERSWQQHYLSNDVLQLFINNFLKDISMSGGTLAPRSACLCKLYKELSMPQPLPPHVISVELTRARKAFFFCWKQILFKLLLFYSSEKNRIEMAVRSLDKTFWKCDDFSDSIYLFIYFLFWRELSLQLTLLKELKI